MLSSFTIALSMLLLYCKRIPVVQREQSFINIMITVDVQDSIAVGISLPKSIISMIDTERGDIPRSQYLLRILEKTYVVATEQRKKKRYGDSKESNTLDSLGRRFETLQPSESKSP